MISVENNWNILLVLLFCLCHYSSYSRVAKGSKYVMADELSTVTLSKQKPFCGSKLTVGEVNEVL